MCVHPVTPACQARPSLRGIFFGLSPDPQCGLVNGLVRAHTEQGALLKDQQQRYSVDMATVAGRGECESPSALPDEHIRQAHLGQLRQGTSDCLENELMGEPGGSPGVAMSKGKVE